jgi:hypothetical protein
MSLLCSDVLFRRFFFATEIGLRAFALNMHNLMVKRGKSSAVLKNKKGSFQPVPS